MDPATVAQHVRGLGGIARSSQLCRRGASRAQLARAVDRGTVDRVRNGVYAVIETSPEIRMAAAHGGELCCASALRHLGVWVLESRERLHVWVGPDARVHQHDGCRCVTHRDEGTAAFGAVSVVHALIQSARCLGSEGFFAAFESAWNLGLLSRSDRALIRQGVPARFRWLVDVARPDAESGIESLLRLRLLRLGLQLECQVFIPAVGRVDFLLAGRIVLEVDGRLNHDGPSRRHHDLVRDAEAAAAGYVALRFDYALVVHDWPRVERAILAALGRVQATPAR
ncbi:type IV toxin-antitoxin system AbiEi family antitoxin domain-containing protein [Microbacterium sp. EYE_5]|uniref:type IV toxin-antitoxin system AbiEi family antitoxin domain-containing protein n=1 Tax=unclassified Microbacterium TaxID=2609290 RepID=UPI00200534C4|nr:MULTISPECIES: type IV toxin-antitoxin system AbiEi family antitoxin domain-containing protein [unclassified Microbacterium]MCK6081851.1 type IV toxin-antitoxin system AbiEi family antitoxin domain-containing protein [Microbacterium sp. EYE_382]MCK6087121.1 type IV toxin-antitoxin system AbiEi family antitoxin domain-containing protein [Microbacterium sp. EYE_384]MCK6124901.1 type IV toxin-antitoxin system AbiEi family antitoxin domain-containing protein [Microbacterium sp. EYE_80]MCK6127884.